MAALVCHGRCDAIDAITGAAHNDPAMARKRHAARHAVLIHDFRFDP